MPFFGSTNVASVCDEWKVHVEQKVVPAYQRVDEYWVAPSAQKSAAGSLQYPHLSRIVETALSLVHNNADADKKVVGKQKDVVYRKKFLLSRFHN